MFDSDVTVEITATMKNGILINHYISFNFDPSVDFAYKYAKQTLENFAGCEIDHNYTVYLKFHYFRRAETFHMNEEPKWNINTIVVKLMNLISKL